MNLDKSVVENLYDPLAVVMNFLVDRDIESPEDRVANKKDETALINLRAYQEGGKVNVDIISDGIGIDTQKVLNTAVANGFVKANEAERFGRKDILDLLFMHNFFLTTIKLDEGEMEVGLHDVRDMLEKIGGQLA